MAWKDTLPCVDRLTAAESVPEISLSFPRELALTFGFASSDSSQAVGREMAKRLNSPGLRRVMSHAPARRLKPAVPFVRIASLNQPERPSCDPRVMTASFASVRAYLGWRNTQSYLRRSDPDPLSRQK